MANITRTTKALDAEIILPDATLSTEATIFKQWQDTFVSPNPVQSQVEFFTNLATRIQNGELDIQVYEYWYEKAKSSHPAVLGSISSNPVYADVNEAIGTLYYAQPTAPSTNNSDLVSSALNIVPANLVYSLPSGVYNQVIGAYQQVNNMYADCIANVVLGKDTASNARNTASKPLIKAQLESKYGVALGLTDIENIVTGDVTVVSGAYNTDIEGITQSVDDLTTVIKGQSPLTTGALQAT